MMTSIQAVNNEILDYRKDAIESIIKRFLKTRKNKRVNGLFESDFVFNEKDAQMIVNYCNRFKLPCAVGYKIAYTGCWEINFTKLLKNTKY